MISDDVRRELRSPLVTAAMLLILVAFAYGSFTQNLWIVGQSITIVVTLYLIYLFIRLVLAVEEIAYEE